MTLDRYDASVALQLWQRFFVLALNAKVVSNDEDVWREQRISALEYLARGRLMWVLGLFFDGATLHEEGDINIYEQAQRGVALVRDDVSTLCGEIDQVDAELRKQLADRCAYIAAQGPADVALELARVPEINDEHRAWLGSPIAAARGEVVAREVEPENPGFNPAFFKVDGPQQPPQQPQSFFRVASNVREERAAARRPNAAVAQAPGQPPRSPRELATQMWEALQDHERRIAALEAPPPAAG